MPLTLSPEVRDLLALTLVPGLGPRLTAALLKHFGSAAAARQATAEQLVGVPHIGPKLSRSFAEALRSADVDAELERMERHGVGLRALGTPDYPESLANIPDPPHVLYVRGTLAETDANAVAIVGSRTCTPYGRRVTERLAAGLVRAGYVVVSGLALGIDGVAHRAALEAGGRTLAVLAGGLSSIYPPEHVELAAAVARSGALLSETPMAVMPQAGMFHARNRIISGLSKAVVVIEARDKSGALITARHAGEQGRDLFVVPANVDSPASEGCLQLLRNGGRVIRHVDDLLEDLNGLRTGPPAPARTLFDPPPSPAPPPPPAPTGPPPGLDDTQRRLWDALAEPKHADVLTRELGVPVAELARVLMQLEMKKVIRRLPGNHYERR